MKKHRLHRLGWLLTLVGTAASPQSPYPAKPMRIIVGFPAGSTPDIVARAVGERLADDLRQPVIVDNRPGAGGTIATETVARATADGYTLNISGCSADTIVYAFVMTNRQPLDPFKNFTPVGRLTRDHWVIAVSPSLNAGTLVELIALGKAKPGLLAFPSPGTGSSQHLQSERFRLRAGIEAIHVPYKDNFLPDLMAGRTSFSVQGSGAVAPLIQSAKLKGLAVLSADRIASLPDVPTSAEAGMGDLTYNAGLCLYAPGGTSAQIVSLLSDSLNKAARSGELVRRFSEIGIDPVQGSPHETAAFVRELMQLVDGLRTTVFGKAR